MTGRRSELIADEAGPRSDFVASFEFRVELGKVLEFRRAVAYPDVCGEIAASPGPIPEGALSAVRPPPTFSVASAHWSPGGASPHALMISAAGFDPSRVVLGDMRWTFHREMVVGDVLRVDIVLIDVVDKVGRTAGPIRIATGEAVYVDIRTGADVLAVRSSLIELRRSKAGDE